METITDKLKKYYGAVTVGVTLPVFGVTSHNLPSETIKYMTWGVGIIAIVNVIQIIIPLFKHNSIMKHNPKDIEYFENGNPKKVKY